MNKFMSAMKSNDTFTANGMVAHSTTGSHLLDFFSSSGAMRGASAESVISRFSAAFSEDYIRAIQAMFYSRDVRGGQGERHNFRVMFRWLCINYPDAAVSVIHFIPEYGRWDDVLAAIGTPVEAIAIKMETR